MASIKEALDKFGRKCWRVRIRIEGFQTISQTLYAPDFKTRKQVEEWAQGQEVKLRERRRTIQDAGATGQPLSEAIAAFKLHKKYKSKGHERFCFMALDWWEVRLGSSTDLADVTPVMVTDGRDKLLFAGYSASSVKKFLQALSGVYTLGNERGWVSGNPVIGIKKPAEPRGRVRYLNDAEMTRLFAAVRDCKNAALAVIVMLALTTGARHGEILGLTWDDVDLVRGRLYFLETKNNARRSVSLTAQAMASLKQWHAICGHKRLVFENTLGKPLTIAKTWQRIITRAKLDDFHFHDLRHSAASFLAMNGVPTVQIADILGHKTLAMVGKYAHLSEDSNRQALEAMADKFLKPLFDSTPKRPPLKRVK